jgi:hypothetical protein
MQHSAYPEDSPLFKSDAENAGDAGFFKVRNQLVRGGHLAKLTRAELAVYLAIQCEANPGMQTGAGYGFLGPVAGVTPRHIRAAVEGLVRRRLIEVVRAGGGNGVRTIYRILEPPKVSLEGHEPRKGVPRGTGKRVPTASAKVSLEGHPINNSLPRTPPKNSPVPVAPGNVSPEGHLLPAPAAPATDGAKPPKGGKRESRHDSLTRQVAPYRQLTDFWSEQKRKENPAFVFVGEDDGVHLAAIWKRVGMNLLLAQGAIVEYMRDLYHEGHPARTFRAQIEKYLARAASPQRSSYGQSKAHRPGEYASNLRRRPTIQYGGGAPA